MTVEKDKPPVEPKEPEKDNKLKVIRDSKKKLLEGEKKPVWFND
jgi:hypothetical protein